MELKGVMDMEWISFATLMAFVGSVLLYLYYRSLRKSVQKVVREAEKVETEGKRLTARLS